MWKQTVSANIFCAGSSSLGEAPSWLQSVRKTQLFWAHILGLNATAAPTETTEDHHDGPGPRLNVHIPEVQIWNRTTHLKFEINISLMLVRPSDLWHHVSVEGPVSNFTNSRNATTTRLLVLSRLLLSHNKSGLCRRAEPDPFLETPGARWQRRTRLHNAWCRPETTFSTNSSRAGAHYKAYILSTEVHEMVGF